MISVASSAASSPYPPKHDTAFPASSKTAAASAGASAMSGAPGTTNVVSHFVRDLLQDNTALQRGILELREMLDASNLQVEELRQRLPESVSRPVSFGSFLSPSAPTAPAHPPSSPSSAEWRRRTSDAAHARQNRSSGEMPVFSLDDDVPREDDGDRRATRYPGVGDTESVLWAGWDILTNVTDGSGDGVKPRCVL